MKNIAHIPVSLLLICGTIALILPWLFFGFHYSDIGWNATKAWMMVAHPSEAFWEFSWLSSMVSGLWMRLTSFSILWFKIGYLVSMVASTLIAYAILRLYYNPKTSAQSLIPVLLLSLSGFEQFAPNYYTLPAIFALSSTYFHLQSLRSQCRRKVMIYALLSGFFFAATIQARMPAVVLGIMFIATALVERLTPGPQKNFLPRLVWTAFGLVIGSGLIVLILHLAGMLNPMIEGIWKTYLETSSYNGRDNIHSPSRLLQDTLIRYDKIAIFAGIAFVTAFLWKRFVSDTDPRLKDPRTIMAMMGVGILTCFLSMNGWESFPPSFGILSILFVTLLLRQRQEPNRERITLYTVALFYMVCMNVGSSNPAVGNLKYTIWLILPVTVIESFNLTSQLISPRLLRWTLFVNIAMLMVTTRIINEQLSLMTMPFQTPVMRGLYGTPKDVEEFESVMNTLNREGVQPGDTMLCYVDIPLLHFTTKTIPALENPWISSHFVGLPALERVRTILSKAAYTAHLPQLVVRSQGLYSSEENDIPKIRFLDSLWGAERYDTIGQSKRFVILRRPY